MTTFRLIAEDIIVLELGEGFSRKIEYRELVAKFGKQGKSNYKLSDVGGVNRCIWLYKYAVTNGRYTSGASTTPEGLVKMKAKIEDKIANLYPHDKTKFESWTEGVT